MPEEGIGDKGGQIVPSGISYVCFAAVFHKSTMKLAWSAPKGSPDRIARTS